MGGFRESCISMLPLETSHSALMIRAPASLRLVLTVTVVLSGRGGDSNHDDHGVANDDLEKSLRKGRNSRYSSLKQARPRFRASRVDSVLCQ
jgi:hypothetical protein